jgi:predicted PurR-regulated permease PerM
MLAGLLSFIPFVGSVFGLVLALLVALAQFGLETQILYVLLVFAVGQFLEGNFITPKLVGESVGLHPIWIIFAIMAGGSLFGFVGMLLAVPLAAVIGVTLRFAITQYLASPYYKGMEQPQTSRRRIGPL